MKKFLLGCLLAAIGTGCCSVCGRFADGELYYNRPDYYEKVSTNDTIMIKTFHVYQGTSDMLYALDAPLRLFTDPPKGPEGDIENAFMTLFWPIEFIDLPFEFVFDTLFLPYDGYRQYRNSKDNKKVREMYGK